MPNQKRTLTPAAIKYLLAISELCSSGRGARSVDVAARLNVSKPSTHHMIQVLCEAGYAERERYGAIYLTDDGRSAAATYGACCERLCEQLESAFGLEKDACRGAAYAALEQLPDALPELEKA